MYDSLLPLIIPSIASPAVFYFMYSYLQSSLPLSLVEAARIDGSGEFRTFNSIVLPIMKPTYISVGILETMWIWNDFLLPLLMLGGRKSSKTLQLAAYSFMGQYKMEWQNIMSAAILIIIPALILYLIFQKSIIKGVVAGAVKG